MSLEKINLRKLLQLFFADARLQQSLLLDDIRKDRTKEEGDRDGGDFYGPFWSDAKDHVAGLSNLVNKQKFALQRTKRGLVFIRFWQVVSWKCGMRRCVGGMSRLSPKKRESSTSYQGAWNDRKNREYGVLENTG